MDQEDYERSSWAIQLWIKESRYGLNGVVTDLRVHERVYGLLAYKLWTDEVTFITLPI
jgi:hypothetical protein